MYPLLIIFNLIWGSYATVFINGPCPVIKPVKNFNFNALARGIWYQIARYPNDWENKEDCSYIEFKNDSDTKQFEIGGNYKGISQFVDGVVELAPDANGNGILIFKSPSFQGQVDRDKMPVYILDVDYDRYVIGYECKYDKATNKRHDFAWIESRTKLVDSETKKIIDNFLQTSNLIKKDYLIWNHFSKDFCKSNKSIS